MPSKVLYISQCDEGKEEKNLSSRHWYFRSKKYTKHEIKLQRWMEQRPGKEGFRLEPIVLVPFILSSKQELLLHTFVRGRRRRARCTSIHILSALRSCSVAIYAVRVSRLSAARPLSPSPTPAPRSLKWDLEFKDQTDKTIISWHQAGGNLYCSIIEEAK